MDMYQQQLMDHYRSTRNRGVLPHANIASSVHNPTCGDMVSIEALSENGVIIALKFTGSGCVISQAAASLLADYVAGKTVEAVAAIEPQTMRDLVGIPLGPTRLRCALLALEALHDGICKFKGPAC
jgi:nitrogen fixation protein NifU and related proteins